jgi:hypothetical protein
MSRELVALSLTPEDRDELRVARLRLEQPSVAARLAALLGMPIEHALHLLPAGWDERLRVVLHGSVARSLQLALGSLNVGSLPAGRRIHMVLGAASGAVAGAFGIPALLLELPVSTTIMLRGIAAVAAQQGEDLRTPVARAECIKVFALGGRGDDDDAAETGYYGLRLSLAAHFARGAQLPGSIAFVRSVASRFGMVFSEKAAAQLVPIAGAICGAAVNAVFVRHFHDVAWGHFTIRRLERRYGPDVVSEAYRTAHAESAGP